MAKFTDKWKIKIDSPFDYNCGNVWLSNYRGMVMLGIKAVILIPLLPFWIIGLLWTVIGDE